MGRSIGRRWTCVIIFGLAVVSLTVSAWLLSRPETTLIERARPLGGPHGARIPSSVLLQSQGWLSSHELLIVTRNDVRKYDILTNESSPFQGLSNLLKAHNPRNILSGMWFDLSPDSGWLHWIDVLPIYERRYVHHIARLDGRAYREWRDDDGRPPVWIDNRHYTLAVWPRDRFDLVEVFDAYDARADRYDLAVRGLILLRLRHENLAPFTYGGTGIEHLQLDLTPSVAGYSDGAVIDPRANLVKIPDSPESDGCIVSPPRTAILYHVRQFTYAPVELKLHRLIPWIKAERRITESLWTSRIDGIEMRELGHVAGGAGGSMLNQVLWLPDGRHISFGYRGASYTMPVVVE